MDIANGPTWIDVLKGIFNEDCLKSYILGKEQPNCWHPLPHASEHRIIAQTQALLKAAEEQKILHRQAARQLLGWLQQDAVCREILGHYSHNTFHERCGRILTQFGLVLELTMGITDYLKSDEGVFRVFWKQSSDGVGEWLFNNKSSNRKSRLRFLLLDAIIVAGEFNDDESKALAQRVLDGIRLNKIVIPGYEIHKKNDETRLLWTNPKMNIVPQASYESVQDDEIPPNNGDISLFDNVAELSVFADRLLQARWTEDRVIIYESVPLMNVATLNELARVLAGTFSEVGVSVTSSAVLNFIIEIMMEKLHEVQKMSTEVGDIAHAELINQLLQFYEQSKPDAATTVDLRAG